MRPIAICMVTLGLLVAPVATAQDDTDIRQDILARDGSLITFYGHTYDVGRGVPMPMNTQYPAGEEDLSRGYGGACGSFNGVPLAVGLDGGVASCEDATQNEAFWYTTAGFVQVKSADEWHGYDQFHNERGQTKDIYLDTAKAANATFYMSADWHGYLVALCDAGAPCWGWDPGYFQDWTIESWVWHASLGDWSSDPSSRPDMAAVANRGSEVTLVAHGVSEPKDLVSFDETIPFPLCDGVCRTVDDFPIAYEWDPDFVASGGVIPFENDLIVEFEWYQSNGDEKYIMSTATGITWNVNSGEDYPANVVLPVRNPLDVELVFPRFVHDKLVILSIINTPWGSYDIDPEMTELKVTDSKGQRITIDPDTITSGVDSSVAHSGHYKPINATWVWDYQAQGLAPGDYTVTVSAMNFQHSYATETSAAFTVLSDGTGGDATAGRSGLQSYSQDDFEEFNQGAGRSVGTPDTEPEPETSEEKDTPGLAPVALIAALGAALVARRWRA